MNREEQDKLEQEQRREFEQLRLEERANQQRVEMMQGQDKESDKTRSEPAERTSLKRKVATGKIKKSKKDVKTALLIIRIFATGGLDFVAWMKLIKQRPFLAIIIVIILILVIVFVLLLVVAIIYLLIDPTALFIPETFKGEIKAVPASWG